MVNIDKVSFGVIVIDGNKYRMRDVLIFPDGAIQRRKFNRWLLHHHKYETEDIMDLVAAGTDTVVIGLGVFSGVKLSDEIREYTLNAPCELIDLPSRTAIQVFNEKGTSGNRVGALIHILC